MIKKLIIAAIIFILGTLFGILLTVKLDSKSPKVTPRSLPLPQIQKPAGEIASYEDCIQAGYPVLESYPASCKNPDGATFTQNIGNELDLLDTIIVDYPRPGQLVESPLHIEGRARGTWFFEASAPVALLKDNGEVLGESHIQATGDWMSEEFVDFSGEINFDPMGAGAGMLVLRNDNPSGMPENELRLEIPVIFE